MTTTTPRSTTSNMTTATDLPAKVHINIGSNAGPSRQIVEAAVKAVEALSEGPARHSDPVLTTPWGFESANNFVNTGVEIVTTMEPGRLLHMLQQLEETVTAQFGIAENLHRNADGSYRDRALDIDIIFYGTRHIATDTLTVPHPRWRMRRFVTGPLEQLHPGMAIDAIWPAEFATPAPPGVATT